MAKQSVNARKHYTAEYKAESLRLAGTVGVAAAARQQENARLKRQVAEQAEELAILKKATAYFAKGLK